MDPRRTIGARRIRRKFRVRKSLTGTPERPRLSISRSHKNISAQVIDDLSGKTLVSASTLDKQLSSSVTYGGNKDAAAAVGKAIAERASEAGIKQVCFDRGSFRYHGRLESLANAAREAGLDF